ncbi:hypothetical protein [Micromonospora wenchangensis]
MVVRDEGGRQYWRVAPRPGGQAPPQP